jgi:hypothetical protein
VTKSEKEKILELQFAINEAKDNVESAEKQYLYHTGWKETCAVPGSYWVWKKDLTGSLFKKLGWIEGQYICDIKMAVRIQKSLFMFENPEMLDD